MLITKLNQSGFSALSLGDTNIDLSTSSTDTSAADNTSDSLDIAQAFQSVLSGVVQATGSYVSKLITNSSTAIAGTDVNKATIDQLNAEIAALGSGALTTADAAKLKAYNSQKAGLLISNILFYGLIGGAVIGGVYLIYKVVRKK